MKINKLFILATIYLFSICAIAGSSKITEAGYGEKWPFTVSEGLLKCSQNEVTFVTGGVAYAVNGSAAAAGFADIEPIWKYNIKMLEELAGVYKKTVEEMKVESPIRISIGPIIKKGLALCE